MRALRRRVMAALPAAMLAALPFSGALAANKISTSDSKQPALLRADEVVYDVNKKLVTAQGHVEIDQGQRILMAERVTYDVDKDAVTADGNVVLLAEDGNVGFADHVTLSDQMRDGAMQGFKALLGKNGRLAAPFATRSGGNVTTMTRAAFTPCKICNQPGQRTPLWEVKAYRVVYDQTQHEIKFHDAVVDVLGVPVLYAPYFSTADPTVKHKSGILTPEVGSSTTLGTFGTLPIYVSLSDSQDFTIAPTLTSESGEVLQGEYRQRWNTGGMWLQASVAHNPNGGFLGHQDDWYSSFFGSGWTPVTNVWRVGYDAELTSNDTYLKRYNLSVEDRLTSDLYVEGLSGRSRFALTGYFFQGLRATDLTATIPLALPVVSYSLVPEHGFLWGQFRADFDGVALFRDFGVDSQRATGQFRWRRPFVTADGQLWTFQVSARGDVYHTTNNDPSQIDTRGLPIDLGSHFVSRGLSYAALDWRWPFVSGGGEHALMVEPIVQLVAAPYGGNPRGIPNEDSTDFELDETNIFSFDRMPGFDLWEPGPRANFGLRTDAYFTGGSVEFLLGESYRPKPVTVFNSSFGIDSRKSDIVGRLTIKFPPHLAITHRVDIDQSDGSIRRNEVYVDADYGRTALRVNYVRLNQQSVTAGLGPREEVDGEASLGLFGNWSVFADGRRDLEANQMLETEYGIGYLDECLGISLTYERKYQRDRDVPPSSTILLRIRPFVSDEESARFNLFPERILPIP